MIFSGLFFYFEENHSGTFLKFDLQKKVVPVLVTSLFI